VRGASHSPVSSLPTRD